MRLYNRQLKSVKDLEKEKTKLQKQRDADEIEALKSKSKKGEGKGNALGTVANFMDLGPVSSILLSRVVPALLKRGKNKKETAVAETETNKSGFIARIAKEFLLGYLKWKALELIIKLVKSFIQKRKEKKLEDKALTH